MTIGKLKRELEKYDEWQEVSVAHDDNDGEEIIGFEYNGDVLFILYEKDKYSS